MKKLLLTIGTLGSIAAPIAAVVSCGSDTKLQAKTLQQPKATKIEEKQEINSVQPHAETPQPEANHEEVQTQVDNHQPEVSQEVVKPQPEAGHEEVQTQVETPKPQPETQTQPEAGHEEVQTQVETPQPETVVAPEASVSHSYTFKNKQEFISASFDEVIDKVSAWVKEHDKGADFKKSNEGNIFRRSKGNQWSVYNLFGGEQREMITKLKAIGLSDQYVYDSLEDAVSALKGLSDEVKATIFTEWNPALSGEFKETSATLEALEVKQTTTVHALNPSIIDTNSFKTQNVGIVGMEEQVLENFAKEVEGSIFTTDLTDQALETLAQDEVSTYTAQQLYIAGFNLPEGVEGKFMVWKNESNVFVVSGELTLGSVHKSISGIVLVGADKATTPSYTSATADIYRRPSLTPISNVEQSVPVVQGSHPIPGATDVPKLVIAPPAPEVGEPQLANANPEQVVVPPVATNTEAATHTYTFNGVDEHKKPHHVSAADLTAGSYDEVIDKIVAHIKTQQNYTKDYLIFRKNRKGVWAVWDIPGGTDTLKVLGFETTGKQYKYETIDDAANALKALTDEQKAMIFTQVD